MESRRPFEWRRANPLGTLIQVRRYPVVLWLLGAVFLWQLGHQVLPRIWAFYTISKFQWSSAQIGYSLAFVGVVLAFAQGVLTRALIPRLGGERPAAAVGMAFAIFAYLGYACATQGWMMYVVSATSMFFAMTYPSLIALMSRQIPHNEQRELQDTNTRKYSLS